MKNYTQRILEEFIEKGADLEHDRWSRWHKYSRLMATPANIEMWDRKAEMPYLALTNEEQESDRKETRNYLPLLEDSIAQALAEERERIDKEITEQFKYASEHNNYDIRGVDWQKIIHQQVASLSPKSSEKAEEIVK